MRRWVIRALLAAVVAVLVIAVVITVIVESGAGERWARGC